MKRLVYRFVALPVALLTMAASLSSRAVVSTALAQSSGCYIEDSDGQILDLQWLCAVSDQPTAESVLQTGDIQVTLRWNTADDLDLIVVDPAGSMIDFGSPTAPSGGQLDVDANGFCQTQSAAPVENIFWPTGSAPEGQYLAYVTLAIPCSLQTLADIDTAAANAAYESLTVNYSLTILNQSETTTHEGISKPEQFGTNYPFWVGSPDGNSAETIPMDIPSKPEDTLDLPSFGLPEL